MNPKYFEFHCQGQLVIVLKTDIVKKYCAHCGREGWQNVSKLYPTFMVPPEMEYFGMSFKSSKGETLCEDCYEDEFYGGD